MKKLMMACVLMLAVSANANLIVNSGFESMSGDPLAPESWTLYTGSGATVYFAAKTDVVYEGVYSEKIAARNGYGMIHQTISDLTGGQSLSFWLYGRGDTNTAWQMESPGQGGCLCEVQGRRRSTDRQWKSAWFFLMRMKQTDARSYRRPTGLNLRCSRL
jgi:hypothetical protein